MGGEGRHRTGCGVRSQVIGVLEAQIAVRRCVEYAQDVRIGPNLCGDGYDEMVQAHTKVVGLALASRESD